MSDHPARNELVHRLAIGAVLPGEPPEWLAALMEPWDAWAAQHLQRDMPRDVENAPCCRSWKRAYALMPKSQDAWDERTAIDPSIVDHDGAPLDRGLRGMSRRLYMLHAVEGDGVATDVHPLCAMERLLCIELADLLAFQIPTSWPDEARIEIGDRIAECRGMLHCFTSW